MRSSSQKRQATNKTYKTIQTTIKNEWKQNKRKQNKSLQNKQDKFNTRVRKERVNRKVLKAQQQHQMHEKEINKRKQKQ